MTKEGTIQLTTPLKINGEDYTELTHDIGKITIEDLAEIERERNEMLGPKAGTIFRVAQNDNLMHTLLGMHAIIKCNPKIDINDLKRVEGYDLCQMAMVGLRFFSRPAHWLFQPAEQQYLHRPYYHQKLRIYPNR